MKETELVQPLEGVDSDEDDRDPLDRWTPLEQFRLNVRNVIEKTTSRRSV